MENGSLSCYLAYEEKDIEELLRGLKVHWHANCSLLLILYL